MTKANLIINKNLNSVFMRSIMSKKGWSKIEARNHLVEFVTCGKHLSLKEFMESK